MRKSCSSVLDRSLIQVARSAASAVAFGLGMFEGQGPLGASRSRAFAVVSETATTDTKLRFHDLCPGYTTAVDESQPHLDELWGRVYGAVAADLAHWTGAPFEAADVDSLWLVCRQQDAVASEGFTADSEISNVQKSGHEEGPRKEGSEGSSREAGDGFSSGGSEVKGPWGPFSACNMFAPEHVAALEWVDDANTFMQKGYGRLVNFRMAVPLFGSMSSALRAAVAARTHPAEQPPISPGNHGKTAQGPGGMLKGEQEEERNGGGVTKMEEVEEEKGAKGESKVKSKKDKKGKKKKKGGVRELAQLHFAHAETIIPLACLLGLFQEPNLHSSTDFSASEPRHKSHSQSKVTGDKDGESNTKEGAEVEGRCTRGPKGTCGTPHAVADTARIFSVLEEVRTHLAAYHGSSPGLPLPLVPVPPPPPSARTWMGRNVAPYAANIGITLVDCGEGDPERFRVLVLHNERAVVLPVSMLPGCCVVDLLLTVSRTGA